MFLSLPSGQNQWAIQGIFSPSFQTTLIGSFDKNLCLDRETEAIASVWVNRHKGKYPKDIAAVYRDKEYMDFSSQNCGGFFLSIILLPIVILLISFVCFHKSLLDWGLALHLKKKEKCSNGWNMLRDNKRKLNNWSGRETRVKRKCNRNAPREHIKLKLWKHLYVDSSL